MICSILLLLPLAPAPEPVPTPSVPLALGTGTLRLGLTLGTAMVDSVVGMPATPEGTGRLVGAVPVPMGAAAPEAEAPVGFLMQGFLVEVVALMGREGAVIDGDADAATPLMLRAVDVDVEEGARTEEPDGSVAAEDGDEDEDEEAAGAEELLPLLPFPVPVPAPLPLPPMTTSIQLSYV